MMKQVVILLLGILLGFWGKGFVESSESDTDLVEQEVLTPAQCDPVDVIEVVKEKIVYRDRKTNKSPSRKKNCSG